VVIRAPGFRETRMQRRTDIAKIFSICLVLLIPVVSAKANVPVFQARNVESLCGLVVINGEPVPGAMVRLQSQKQDQTLSERKTDQDGRYQFSSVPKGKYWVQIESPAGLGAVFIHLKKSSSSVCKEMIQTNIHPGQMPEDDNNSVKSLSSDVEVGTKVKVMTTPFPVSECPNEIVEPNLVLDWSTHVTGKLQDQTTAPFKKSQIVLQRYEQSSSFVEIKTITTDESGKFDLGVLEAGKYRLLASPHRGFAQPEFFECTSEFNCRMEVTLKVNPTDLPYAACPIK
jgi:5-hydroxyisourate hydrolase-like protein (transthyretin family)